MQTQFLIVPNKTQKAAWLPEQSFGLEIIQNCVAKMAGGRGTPYLPLLSASSVGLSPLAQDLYVNVMGVGQTFFEP